MAKLTQCPNGHFYDMERSPQCPYCDGRSEAMPPPLPPDCPGEEEFLARLAEREAANKTHPLDDAGMDRAQPLYDAGTDRTVPLDEGSTAPAPLRREAGWQRWLLLAAAGLAAACTLFSLIDLMRWLLQ